MYSYRFFLEGILNSLHPMVLVYMAFGMCWGMIGGAIPGISASVAMTLALPFCYGLDPMLSLPMISAVYIGAEYGGSIPAILIKTPGTASNAATVLDGYEMNRKGMGGKALFTSLYSGFVGGTISVLLLVACVIPLASFALKFGPTEYFWMILTGLSIVGTVSGKSPLKGLIAAAFGLLLAIVGTDKFASVTRFTFGIYRLREGLETIPVLVGIFAVGEVLRQIFRHEKSEAITTKVIMTYPSKKEIATITPLAAYGGIIGSIVGALPGAGATIASWLAYSQAKMLCKNTETFGTGDIRGVAAPESSNNAVPAGALIPLLALGIPGSNSAAILMAAFGIAGISCGPLLFVNNPSIPYHLMGSMFVAQVIMLMLGLLIIKPFVRITRINKVYLNLAVLMFAMIGAFSTINDIFAIYVLIFFGVVGFLMKKFGFPPAATVLGFILGELAESNLRRALQLSRGSFGIFFKGPINIVLIIITITGVLFPVIAGQIKKRRKAE